MNKATSLNGRAARVQGYPLSANPNCYGSAAHRRWSAAWHEENYRLQRISDAIAGEAR